MEVIRTFAADAFQDNECYVLNGELAEKYLSPLPKIAVYSIICREPQLPREMELLYTACFSNAKDFLGGFQVLFGAYKAWLFIADSSWQPQSVIVKHKRIWKKLEEKWRLIGINPFAEIENISSEGIRYAGLAELNDDGFGLAFQLMREYSSAVILSQRTELGSKAGAEEIFGASFPLKKGLPIGEIDWLRLVLSLCPLGDVVIKVGGSFGERAVSVDFFMGVKTLEKIQKSES